jgi:hypothetical protein
MHNTEHSLEERSAELAARRAVEAEVVEKHLTRQREDYAYNLARLKAIHGD